MFPTKPEGLTFFSKRYHRMGEPGSMIDRPLVG